MYPFVVELKTALLLFANSIWLPPQVKTCYCSTLLLMDFSFCMEKACYPKCDLTCSFCLRLSVFLDKGHFYSNRG